MQHGSPALWEQVADAFLVDGSLRDIVVRGTTIRDWQWLLDQAAAGTWPSNYWEDGEPAVMPSSAAVLFEHTDIVSSRLAFYLGEILINCPTFWRPEMELDVDPRQIQTAQDFELLEGFVATMGRGLGKLVLLTYEMSPKEIIAYYSPISDAVEAAVNGRGLGI